MLKTKPFQNAQQCNFQREWVQNQIVENPRPIFDIALINR